MRPYILTRLTALLACVVMTACSDTHGSGITTTSEPVVLGSAAPRPSLSATGVACTLVDATQLEILAIAAFSGGSPNPNSVIGKIRQLRRAVTANNYVAARREGFSIMEFTLRKNSQRPLGGTKAEIAGFLNAVSCFARLNFVIGDLGGTYIVNPGDGARTLPAADDLAGLRLTAGTVQEPTVFSISPIDFAPTRPGSGPLSTKLDQYRGFYDFQKTSANNLPLLQNVVVGVCAPASLNAGLFARLRLGHDASAGFRIEPPANADFLNCATAYAAVEGSSNADRFLGAGLLGRVASLFTPRIAFAASADAMFAGGGVGGLASELSPFAPVDATVSFAGGVGGLASELRIHMLEPAPGTCSGQAPAGNALDPACRPKVSLATKLDTPLAGAPVTFTATQGGGLVALQSAEGSCGAFATSVIATTLADGTAQVCWTLGSALGRNRLRAVGGIGGDVPAGTTYENARFFTITGISPSRLVLLAAPPSGASVVAGGNIPVSVAMVDASGAVITSFNGQVTLGLRRAGDAATFALGTQTVATAISGVATFSTVRIETSGTGYSLRLSGTFAGTSITVDGASFDVAATSAASIVGQVVFIDQIDPRLIVMPTVRVLDKFGNPVRGALVTWTTGGGSVMPQTSTTDSDGRTSTIWTLAPGSNFLKANSGPFTAVLSATGVPVAP